MRKLFLVFALVLAVVVSVGTAACADEFLSSKRLLLSKVYGNRGATFYCLLPFFGNRVEVADGFVPAKQSSRAFRLEWEHVVPASRFGRTFPAWTDGDPACVDKGKPFRGRKCARVISPSFRAMEADMHNLVPANGQVNGYRSDFPFSELPEGKSMFGSCPMKIVGGMVDPPAHVRGDIARIHFYMVRKYPERLALADWEVNMFLRWHEQDPVDRHECLRERVTAAVAGYENEVVRAFCDQMFPGGVQ